MDRHSEKAMTTHLSAGGPNDAKLLHRREGGITLGALRTFVAVVETGSFSRAASSFGISQPTVSIQLNNLEQACGMPLLHRRPRIALTEAGRELFIRARQILSRLEEFEAVARDLSELQRGRLSVGLSTPAYAMPLLASFMAAQPAINVSTRIGNTATLLDDVAQCRIDIGVMTLDGPVSSLHCALIAPQRLTVIIAQSDPWAKKETVHLAELAQRPLVMREEGSMTRRLIEAAFAARDSAPRACLEVGSREAVKEAVAAGIGVGILLEGELRGDARLAELPLTGTSIVGGVYAVALKEAVDIPVVGAFLSHAASLKPLMGR
jgi:DNA-binding transcriptional LysR family regulator